MSRKIKAALAQAFGKKRSTNEDVFQGTSSNESRRESLRRFLPPELQGREIAFQRTEVI